MRRGIFAIAVSMLVCVGVQPAVAQKKYGPGVTDTEIKLGQTMPYSGGASGISIIGRIHRAYFNMINAQGGVNGRKINMISLDDAFSPPKTVEQVRVLVEREEVLAMFAMLGSGPNLAVAKYLNTAKVPQLLSMAGTPKLIEADLPWTTTFSSTLTLDAMNFATFILETKPDAKIGIIYQNDETGKAYLEGMKVRLGDKAATMIVMEVAFDLSYPTIDSQILQLRASGADTIYFATVSPKFGAQGVRKIGELGWKPQILMNAVSDSLKLGGAENLVGAVTHMFHLHHGEREDKEPAMQTYYAFLKQWAPTESTTDALGPFAYSAAELMVDLLKRCGDDLTRENLLDKATHIKGYQPSLFIPGLTINVTPEDHIPWKQVQMARFDGKEWVFFGDLVSAVAPKK